jgi:V8-like Glu-specific endopeptidase
VRFSIVRTSTGEKIMEYPQVTTTLARVFSAAAVLLATWGGPALTLAAEPLIMERMDATATLQYWTPERLKSAKPLPLPQSVIPDDAVTPLDAEAADGEVEGTEGEPPTVRVRPDLLNRLFEPERDSGIETQEADASSTEPSNVGTSGAPFSSARLIPLSADREYPYRTVGKLFFTIPGLGDYICSGAVLKYRIVLTAGHCVHSGDSSGLYTNFLFIPAYRDGVAPFQSWSAAFVAVTTTWATGGGTVPNAADYAMIEVQDRTVNGSLRRIGDVTGTLGWLTNRTMQNHAHLLGYPQNLDSGQKMQQVTAESFRAVSPNNAEYGSDMRGGSSGGPWVQNLGGRADATGVDNRRYPNRVVGITSYGYVSTSPLAQGSSIPDSRFTNLYNGICSHRGGNC